MDRIWREFGRHLDTLSKIDNAYDFLTLVLVSCNSVFPYATMAYVAYHVHTVMMRDGQATGQGVNAGPPGSPEAPPGPSGPQASGGFQAAGGPHQSFSQPTTVGEGTLSHSSAVGPPRVRNINRTVIYQDASTEPDPLLSALAQVECQEVNYQRSNKAPAPIKDTSAEKSAKAKALWKTEHNKAQLRSREMVKPEFDGTVDDIQVQVPEKGTINSPDRSPKISPSSWLPVVEQIRMTNSESVEQSKNANLQTSHQEGPMMSDATNRMSAHTDFRAPFRPRDQGNFHQRSYTKIPVVRGKTIRILYLSLTYSNRSRRYSFGEA
jgi:hypothetical protein